MRSLSPFALPLVLTLVGCSAAPSEPLASTTSPLDDGDTTFETPDVKSTLHIEYFGVINVCGSLQDNGWFAACFDPIILSLLEGLRESANPSPPDDFGNGAFAQWTASKEYRGYVHIAPLRYTCNAGGQLTSWANPEVAMSDGFTKEATPVNVLGYSESDAYRGSATFTGVSVEPLDRGDCAIVHAAAASRVNDLARALQYTVLGVDAPFVVEHVYERICCDGSVDVSVERTHFPTARLYVNDAKVDQKGQENLGGFMKSGGKDFHDSGQGNVASLGDSLRWQGTASRP